MIRFQLATCAALIASAQCALAADRPPVPLPDSRDAAVEQLAEKSCNDALDRGTFGNYDTVEQCVSETYEKLRQTSHTQAARQAAVDPRKPR